MCEPQPLFSSTGEVNESSISIHWQKDNILYMTSDSLFLLSTDTSHNVVHMQIEMNSHYCLKFDATSIYPWKG